MAVAPASAAAKSPSAKGKNASDATTDPWVKGTGNPIASAISMLLRAAIRVLSMRLIWPAPMPTVAWAPVTGQPQGRLLAIGQVLLNNADNAPSPANGKVYMINDRNGEGLWTEVPAPVPVPNKGDDPCPNYSSQLLPSADGLTVLEVALNFVDNRCQAFYNTAPLPAPSAARPAPKARRKGR